MAKAVLLINFDGVLNVDRPLWDGNIRDCEVTDSAGESWHVRYAQELAKKLLDMHNTGRVELRWCTSWCNDADVLEKALGWPRLYRTLYTPGLTEIRYSELTNLKLQAAFEVVEVEQRPLIWIDADAVPTGGAHQERLCQTLPALLIKPDTTSGLTREHITRIMDFTSRLTG